MAQVNTDDSPVQLEKGQMRVVDITDLSLPEGKREAINPDADAWAVAIPPPDGVYLVRLFFGREAFQIPETDWEGKKIEANDIFYKSNLECKIEENSVAELNGRILFAQVSSYIGAGKEISTMAGLIRKMGPKVPKDVTHLELCRLFKKVVGQEPRIYVEGEWRAWDKYKEQNVAASMAKFPLIEGTKQYSHIIRNSKGEEVAAKWKPTKWYGLKEYKVILEQEQERRKRALSGGRASSGTGAGKQEVVSNGGGFVDMVPAAVATATAAAPPVASTIDEDFIIDE